MPSLGAISLFVDDVHRAKAWYQLAFDVPVVFEDASSAVVQFDNTVLNLLVRSAAHELIAPSAVALAGSGSTLQFTIWVDDLDTVIAGLDGKGIVLLNGPIDRVWGQRTACIVDPDGHVWEFAQSLD